MTVAAAIEIGAVETPALGLGKTPGTVHSAGRADASTSGLLSSTVSSATSFRAGWQSLLASLSSGMAISAGTEADQGTASAGSTAGQTKTSVSTSTLAAGAGSLLGQGTEKGSVETGAESMLSSAVARTQAVAAELAARAAKPASAGVEAKISATKPGTESATESTRSSRLSRSTNTTKTDAVSTEPLPGLLPAATASLSQAAPVAAIVSSVAQSPDVTAQPARTEISAALSTDQPAAVASLNVHPPVIETPTNHVEAVNPAVQQIAEGPETSARQRQASPVSNLSSSSSSTVVSEAESAAADKDVTPTVSVPADGGNSTETPTPARSLALSIHAAAQNANPAETLAPSQASSQTLVSKESGTPKFVQNQEQVAIQQGNQGANVVTATIPSDSLNSLSVTASVASQAGQLSAQSPAQSKPGSASSGKTQTSESIHGNSNSVQHLSQLTVGQSSAPALEASAMARALAGAGGTVNTSGDAARTSSTAASGPDSREAFATLDGAGAPVATTWIHAGTQRAEAGYQDSALGWVGVRADLSGGGVHAQLVPGSADAAQTLDGHLAGLNAYLAEHHTPVETLTLTAPESGWSGSGSGQNAGEGMQQGAGQQNAQGADASTPSNQSTESVIQPPATSAELPAFFGDMNGSTQSASLDGFHISVMA